VNRPLFTRRTVLGAALTGAVAGGIGFFANSASRSAISRSFSSVLSREKSSAETLRTVRVGGHEIGSSMGSVSEGV